MSDGLSKKEIEYCLKLFDLKPVLFSKKTYSFNEIRRFIEKKNTTSMCFYFIQRMIQEGCLEFVEKKGNKDYYVMNYKNFIDFIEETPFIDDKSAYVVARELLGKMGKFVGD